MGSMHKDVQTRGVWGMLPQANLQPLRLFLVAYETASGTINFEQPCMCHNVDHTHLY